MLCLTPYNTWLNLLTASSCEIMMMVMCCVSTWICVCLCLSTHIWVYMQSLGDWRDLCGYIVHTSIKLKHFAYASAHFCTFYVTTAFTLVLLECFWLFNFSYQFCIPACMDDFVSVCVKCVCAHVGEKERGKKRARQWE